MAQKTVLQAVDSPRRDTEWRLFLASKLSKAGISSVIASKADIRKLHYFSKNCIFLGRLDSNAGRNSSDKLYLKRMQENGTDVFFIHDEGAFFFLGDYEGAVKRVYPKEFLTFKFVRKMFFWGENQKQYLVDKGAAENDKRLIVTGFPRFDLCKERHDPLDKAAAVAALEKYGDFILICGRFSAANMVADDTSALSKRYYEILIEGGASEQDRNDLLDSMFSSWEKVTYEFSRFIPVIAKLAMEFPRLNFLVRPHPAERESFYTDSFAHFSNVFVSKEGDVRPLVRAAKAVIQSECSTGVEAEISRTPNINFRPTVGVEKFKAFEVSGLTDVGVVVKDFEEMKNSLHILRHNNFSFEENGADLSCYIHNFKNNVEASDLIVKEIAEFCREDQRDSYIPKWLLFKFLGNGSLKDYVRPIYHRYKRRVSSRSTVKGDTKYFGFSDDHVRSLWEKFEGSPECLSVNNGIIYTYPEYFR